MIDAEWHRNWRLVRDETMSLMDMVNDKKLAYIPEGNKNWQPLSYQFACIGRTQLVYAWALAKGRMEVSDFTAKGLPDIKQPLTKAVILELLEWSESEWQKALIGGFEHVQMGKEQLSVTSYVARLIGHERLHHGQIISYFTLAGMRFPTDFKRNWAL